MTDSAVEAAAAATFDVYRCGNCGDGMCPICMTMRRAMYAAAMPAIREALAQEIEAGSCDPVLYRVAKALVADAARIVRGGTP